jgi:hypothetical protein
MMTMEIMKMQKKKRAKRTKKQATKRRKRGKKKLFIIIMNPRVVVVCRSFHLNCSAFSIRFFLLFCVVPFAYRKTIWCNHDFIIMQHKSIMIGGVLGLHFACFVSIRKQIELCSIFFRCSCCCFRFYVDIHVHWFNLNFLCAVHNFLSILRAVSDFVLWKFMGFCFCVIFFFLLFSSFCDALSSWSYNMELRDDDRGEL